MNEWKKEEIKLYCELHTAKVFYLLIKYLIFETLLATVLLIVNLYQHNVHTLTKILREL